MAVNKVEVNGETVLDLTNDTVSEDSLLDGTTAHDKAGNPIEGKVKLSSVSIKDNEDGGIDISVDEQKKTVASQESVSQIKGNLANKVSKTDYAPEVKTDAMTQPVGKDENGKLWTAPSPDSSFTTDKTLSLKDGVLSVNTTNNMEQDNTLPITSAGVYATVGNIEALLKTI